MNIDTLRRIFPTGYIGAQQKNYAVATSTNSTELATLADDGVTWTLTAAGVTAAATNETDSAATSNAVGIGAKVGATVTVAETSGDLVKTVLTLASTPLVLADDAGNGQWVAVEVYNFPAGNINVLGATANLSIALTETWWVDASTGTFGIGAAANTDASAIGTTRQNILQVTNIAALTAQAGPVTGQSSASLYSAAAGGTDSKAYLNIKIADNAAHCPTLATNGTFTGAATGWTLGSGWAYGTNNVAATTASTAMTQSAIVDLIPGQSYSVAFDATRSAGSVQPSLGGTAGTSRSSSATFTETIVAGSDGTFKLTGTGFTGTIDNITITPLTGIGTISGTITMQWLNLGDF